VGLERRRLVDAALDVPRARRLQDGDGVAPVADVHNYDTIYQERYVGLPSTDSAAYYDASAINFAGGLKGDPSRRPRLRRRQRALSGHGATDQQARR
jgi:hypothetical protein